MTTGLSPFWAFSSAELSAFSHAMGVAGWAGVPTRFVCGLSTRDAPWPPFGHQPACNFCAVTNARLTMASVSTVEESVRIECSFKFQERTPPWERETVPSRNPTLYYTTSRRRQTRNTVLYRIREATARSLVACFPVTTTPTLLQRLGSFEHELFFTTCFSKAFSL